MTDFDLKGLHARLQERYGLCPKAMERYAQSEPARPLAQDEGNVILMYGPIVDDQEAIFLRDVLGSEAPVISPLDFKAKLDAVQGDVVLRINSPGGSVIDGAAIMADIVDRQNAGDRVDAVVTGQASSMAANFLALATSAQAYQSSIIMIHQARVSVFGETAQGLRSVGNVLDIIDGNQTKLLAEKMGISENAVFEFLSAETFFSAEQALANGLIEGIIEAPADMPLEEAPAGGDVVAAGATSELAEQMIIQSATPDTLSGGMPGEVLVVGEEPKSVPAVAPQAPCGATSETEHADAKPSAREITTRVRLRRLLDQLTD